MVDLYCVSHLIHAMHNLTILCILALHFCMNSMFCGFEQNIFLGVISIYTTTYLYDFTKTCIL